MKNEESKLVTEQEVLPEYDTSHEEVPRHCTIELEVPQ